MEISIPEKYRVDRLPREQLIKSLLSRKGRRWAYREKYLWVWNVKIHEFIRSWDDIAKELETVVCDYIGRQWWEDPDFQVRARNAVSNALAQENRDFSIWNLAVDDMRLAVSDDDAFSTLWSGRNMHPDWVFAGRSGGWLCLNGLLGTSFRNWEACEYRDWLEELEDDDLFDVYQFLHQCDVGLADEQLEAQFTFQFAYNLRQVADLDMIPKQLLAERAVLVNGDGI